MDISNSLTSLPAVVDVVKQNNHDRRDLRNEASSRNGEFRTEQAQRLASSSELEKKSNQLQLDRVQRVDSLESAPLSTQQAVNTYQQTVEAGRAYEEGELVGIDLFV